MILIPPFSSARITILHLTLGDGANPENGRSLAIFGIRI